MNFLRIPKPGLILKKLSNKSESWDSFYSKETIDFILANYNLGSVQIVNGLGGGNSTNILIQTASGKKVLKRYFWSLESTQYEHSIIKYLSERRFIIPQIVPNKNGLSYTVIKNNHYAIYDYIDGFRITDYFIPAKSWYRYVCLAADTLATYHQHISGFVPSGRKLNGYQPNGVTLWRDRKWHLRILNKYLASAKINNSGVELADYILSIKEKIERGINETGKYFDQSKYQLPILVTHGDYSPKNVLYNKKGGSAVIDFGDANLNLRVMDVARGLATFSKMNNKGICKKFSQAFLESYTAKQPLLREEIAVIPDIIQWRHLKNIVWLLFNNMENQFNIKDEKNQIVYIQNKWKSILWIKKHAADLKKSFKEVLEK